MVGWGWGEAWQQRFDARDKGDLRGRGGSQLRLSLGTAASPVSNRLPTQGGRARRVGWGGKGKAWGKDQQIHIAFPGLPTAGVLGSQRR